MFASLLLTRKGLPGLKETYSTPIRGIPAQPGAQESQVSALNQHNRGWVNLAIITGPVRIWLIVGTWQGATQ